MGHELFRGKKIRYLSFSEELNHNVWSERVKTWVQNELSIGWFPGESCNRNASKSVQEWTNNLKMSSIVLQAIKLQVCLSSITSYFFQSWFHAQVPPLWTTFSNKKFHPSLALPWDSSKSKIPPEESLTSVRKKNSAPL